MSKERLEEYTHIAVKKDEYKKLKKQAERVHELEGDVRMHERVSYRNIERNIKLEQQNKRYRETLEFYAEKENYQKSCDSFSDTGHSESVVQQDAGKKARNLLRGINNAGL